MPPKLGIVAGRGKLPARLIEACRATGRDVFVVAIEGQTEEAVVNGVSHHWVTLGAVGKALNLLREAGVAELVFAGPVTRPSLSSLRPDARTAKFLAKLGKAALGDDGLLSAIVREFEGEGFRVVGADDILGEMLAPMGPLGNIVPDEVALGDIARAATIARALGVLDVAQAVVVQQGIVLGIEAVEGTDALLARCKTLKCEGPGGVLVKVKKPMQERRVDLPTIGPRTVTAAADAGLRGIAIEAGNTLLIDRAAVTRTADAAGLFVVGIAGQK